MASRKQSARKSAARARNPLGAQSTRNQASGSAGGIRKQRKRPGTVAALEIQKYQASNKLLIPKLPFQRLVREISQDLSKIDGLRFHPAVFQMLQQTAEEYLVSLFKDTNLVAENGKRIAIQPKDMRLVHRLRENRIQH